MMKTIKLSAAVVGIGLMLCGYGNEATSDVGHQEVRQYASPDGNYRVIGPAWDCSKRIDGEWYFPVMVAEKGKDGRVCWCREVSRGSSGNFEVVSNDGAFYFSDSSFCSSDEMKFGTYMDIISGTATNRIELGRVEQ